MRVTPVAAAVNTLEAAGAVSGAAPTLSVQGANADIDLKLSPKGAGHVRFGQYTAAGGLSVTGYVEIKDAGGAAAPREIDAQQYTVMSYRSTPSLPADFGYWQSRFRTPRW
ncbi:hypothetical protein [Azospirillum argentinense]|uniref:Uncharacterized protein n=1 Tax=Azospirillum brasilense TaxID=192 RepID=A0A4D8QPN0_AZOBR|nr:hypothetical protein [Azospirillum argentinense]QCO07252.1 hypothetical protein D3867_35130 [Azospirillum argentinense]